MSVWSHIYAYLEVDTCRDQFIDEFESADLTAKELFKHAPQITGGEGPAEVLINASKLITVIANVACAHIGRETKKMGYNVF